MTPQIRMVNFEGASIMAVFNRTVAAYILTLASLKPPALPTGTPLTPMIFRDASNRPAVAVAHNGCQRDAFGSALEPGLCVFTLEESVGNEIRDHAILQRFVDHVFISRSA